MSSAPSQQDADARVVVETGWGAGVIIDPSGLILTNDHLLHHAYRIKVQTSDGQRLPAEVVGRDPESDVALLRIHPAHAVAAARLGDSSRLRVGDFVAAVGNPFGLGKVMSLGVVGAIGRLAGKNLPDEEMIQTDAPLNPGNSGGPLFNLAGEIVGINTAAVSGAQGLGFAIPARRILPLIPVLKQRGRVERGWLGADAQDLDPDLRSYFHAPRGGALVTRVHDHGPAKRAGLMRGDVIVALNGQPVRSAHGLKQRTYALPYGAAVTIDLVRRGRPLRERLVLAPPPEPPAVAKIAPRPVIGIQGVALTSPLASLLGLRARAGLLVVRVEVGSRAFDAGVRPGDVVVEVDSRPVISVDDYETLCWQAQKADRAVVLLIEGKEGPRYVALKHLAPPTTSYP